MTKAPQPPAADLDAIRATVLELATRVEDHERRLVLLDRLLPSHRRLREQVAELRGRVMAMMPAPVHVTLTHAGAGPTPIPVQPPPPPTRNGRPTNGCGPDVLRFLRRGSKFYSEIVESMAEAGHSETTVRRHLQQLAQLGIVIHEAPSDPYTLLADIANG
jgi:inactivated superfamily I helicase